MSDPVISIVISNFNYGRYLSECIESALRQTYPLIQVIVIDDGSTDESSAIVGGYGDRIESVLRPHSGQGAAWNASMSMVTGSWVLYLDSDDRLLPGAAERIAAAVRANPGCSKIHWPMRLIGADGGYLGIQIPGEPLPSGDRMTELKFFGFDRGPNMATSGNCWSVEFARSVLPMPDADFVIGADTWLLGLAPLFGRFAAVDLALSEYRSHTANNGSQGTECQRACDIISRSVLVFRKVEAALNARGYTVDIVDWIDANPTVLRYRQILNQCVDDTCRHQVPGVRGGR